MDEDTERCPSCGTELEEDATECPDCGELIGETKEEAIARLQKLPGLGRRRAKKLYQEGLTTPEEIVEEGKEGLADIDQIGSATADSIVYGAKKLVEKEEGEEEAVLEESVIEVPDRLIEEDTEEDNGVDEQEDLQDVIGKEVEMDLKKIEELIEGRERSEVLDEDLRVEIEELEETFEENEKIEEVEEPEVKVTEFTYNDSIADLVPVFSSFLIPIFLVLFVGLEFVITLLGYPSVYPARTMYFLTPLPYFEPSWISSLTLSFVVTLSLFVTTWRAYQFESGSGVKLSKYMISVSAVFSVIIIISLILHMYWTRAYSGMILTLILLILTLFLLVTQFELLRRKETTFPKIEERKVCPECGETVPLHLERCSFCGSEITLSSESEKGLVEESLGTDMVVEDEELGEEKIETKTALDDLEKILEEIESDNEETVFVCPICDTEMEEDVDECPECGTVFVE